MDGRGRTKTLFCAEPSPDALSAISAAISGSLSANVAGQGSGAAGLGIALREAASQLGKRELPVEVLRDIYFRLCEAYFNGMISEFQYYTMSNKVLHASVIMHGVHQLTRGGPGKGVTTQATGKGGSADVSTSAGGTDGGSSPGPSTPSPGAGEEAEGTGGGGSEETEGTAGGAPSPDDNNGGGGSLTGGAEATATADAGAPAVTALTEASDQRTVPLHVSQAVVYMVDGFLMKAAMDDCLAKLDDLTVIDFAKEHSVTIQIAENIRDVCLEVIRRFPHDSYNKDSIFHSTTSSEPGESQ